MAAAFSYQIARQLSQRVWSGDLRSARELFNYLIRGDIGIVVAGTPNGSATPHAIGEWAYDSTNGAFYRAGSLLNTGWVRIARNATVVPLAVTTALTVAAHAGTTIPMSGAGGARTFTLPAATGSGEVFRFVVDEVNTSNYLIKVSAGTMVMRGMIIGQSAGDSATDAPRTWVPGTTDDTITLNGTTTGGVHRGNWIELQDVSTTHWAVRGFITQSGTEATPFSDTVA